MRANSLIAATAHTNGIITLEGIDRNELKIVGASVGNLPGDNRESNSFSFSIKQGEKGMVALKIYYKYGTGKNSGSNSYEFFLGAKWEEGQEKPFIDLQNQWVPEDPARLGCFYHDSLEVVIDGITFSGSPCAGDKDGKCRVKDANLLCRYMDSKITAEELRETLGLPAKEQSAREELKQAKEKIARLETEFATLQERNSTLEKWHETTQSINQASTAISQKATTEWKTGALRLKGAVLSQWIPLWLMSKSVKQALKMFPPE